MGREMAQKKTKIQSTHQTSTTNRAPRVATISASGEARESAPKFEAICLLFMATFNKLLIANRRARAHCARVV